LTGCKRFRDSFDESEMITSETAPNT